MALFSQRFWMQLSTLDARIVATQRAHQAASSRLLVGRRLVTGTSLVDYWIDVTQTTHTAGDALVELNHFCTGRSRPSSQAAASVRVDHVPDFLPGPDPSPAMG